MKEFMCLSHTKFLINISYKGPSLAIPELLTHRKCEEKRCDLLDKSLLHNKRWAVEK